jgi:ketosteroid isomerase-like protein
VSEENVAIVKPGWEHFQATGELLVDIMAPDFVWDLSTFRDLMGLAPQYKGAEGTGRFLREWSEPFGEWRVDVESYHDSGDKVVTVCRHRARSKASGVPVEMHTAFVAGTSSPQPNGQTPRLSS